MLNAAPTGSIEPNRPRHDECHDRPDERRARCAGRSLARPARARGLCARGAGDPAAGRTLPRPLGRGHPQAHVSHYRSARPRAVPAARPHHPGLARLPRLARGRKAAGLLLSRSGLPPSRRSAGRVPASRHRILRPPGQGGGGRRNARARARRHRPLRTRPTRHPHRRCRAVFGADRRARSGTGLEAAPDQGLQPQELARARSRAAQHQRLASAVGIPGRAGGARRLRSQGRACAGHRPALDRRHHRGRRALGRRDRRSLSRAGGARCSDVLAAGDARADREIPRHRRRSRRGGGGAARLRPGRKDRARCRARFIREPHRVSGRARRRRHPHQVLHRLRPRSSRDNGPLVAGGRYDGLLTRLGSANPIPAVGLAVWIERLAALRSGS
jgi:hypothetical protein